MSWALLGFVIVATVTPGPNNIMLMASGMNHGFRASLPHLLGIGFGFVAMVIIVALSLAQVIFTYPWIQTVLKFVSLVFVLWLAWKIANSKPAGTGDTADLPRPFKFYQAVAFQWVNPKAWAMTVAASAAFIDPDNKLQSALIVAATFGVVNFPNGITWCLCGVTLRRIFSDPKTFRLINIGMAVALVLTFLGLF